MLKSSLETQNYFFFIMNDCKPGHHIFCTTPNTWLEDPQWSPDPTLGTIELRIFYILTILKLVYGNDSFCFTLLYIKHIFIFLLKSTKNRNRRVFPFKIRNCFVFVLNYSRP